MSNDLDELNLALHNLDWSDPDPQGIRFYYNPLTRIGTRIGGSDDDEPWVLITQDKYQEISADVAFKFYLSKAEEVKRIPVVKGMRKLLESSDTGPYRTVKDCIIFADPNGPDAYQRREFDYD